MNFFFILFRKMRLLCSGNLVWIMLHTMAHGQDSESPCPLGADRWRGTHLRELARTAGVYLGREYGATALKNTYTYHRSARIRSSTQSDTTNRPKCLGADRARGRPWLISGTQHENTRTST